ncbi:MAG: pyridoxamine 5'-phosphate oxidase family protein [Firmicutes bacterium]|jgi:nitroimidazol reductase NimA-like FMN-containing flavoprotein (pyridoxamine 5'-phosphate oxidase superfamily)|nr:pyridoxamine 5'-phosphate oxidase family protein [Bacillota bacterium]
MRRVDREISRSEALALLTETKAGVLAMVDACGAPYAIPVNHALIDGDLIIHCAKVGRKIDCLRNDNRICYTTYHMAHICPEKLTTKYISVVVMGRAELVEDLEVKRELLRRMTESLAPGAEFTCDERIVADTGVIRIKIDEITGKANR